MRTYKPYTYIHFLMMWAGMAAIMLAGAGQTAAQTTTIARDTFSTNTLTGGEFAWAVAPWWTVDQGTVTADDSYMSLQGNSTSTSRGRASRPVTLLAGYTTITLTFRSGGTRLDSGEGVRVLVNGAQEGPNFNGNTWTNRTVDLTDYAGQPITLAFLVYASRTDEYAYVDDIVITGVGLTAPTMTPTATPTQVSSLIAHWCFEDTDYPFTYQITPWDHLGCNLMATGGAHGNIIFCENPGGVLPNTTLVISPSFALDGVTFPSMELTFEWLAANLQNTETVAVEISLDNGTSWTEATECALDNATLTTNPGTVQTRTCTLSYASGTYPNARLRFVITGLDTTSDYIGLDCVDLTGITIPAGNCPFPEWTFEPGVGYTGWTITGCNNEISGGNTSLHCGATTVTAPEVDATGYTDLCLQFDWWGVGLDNNNDDFSVEASTDGTTWTTVCTIDTTDGMNGAWNTTTCDFSAYDGDDPLYFRFNLSEVDNNQNEQVWLDNVSICENADCGGTTPEITPTPTWPVCDPCAQRR